MFFDDYEGSRSDRESLENARVKCVRNSLYPNEYEAVRYKPYAVVLDQFTRSSLEYALQTKMDRDTFVNGPLNAAMDVVDQFRSVTIEWSDRFLEPSDPDRMIMWRHDPDLAQNAIAKKIPYLDRTALESAVGDYLDLGFRCPLLDRLFVDALVALELTQYYKAVLHEMVIPEIGPPRSPLLQRHALATCLQNVSLYALILSICLALGIIFADFPWGGLVGLGSFVVGAFCFFMMVANLIILPSSWRDQSRARRKVRELMDTMNGVYLSLGSEGPISARFVLAQVEKGADKGIVWPAPLMALLDDIVSRGGKF